MKTASVLAALVVCLVGGLALGFGLGSAEVVQAVSPQLDTARLDVEDDAPAPLALQAPLDARALDVDRGDDERDALAQRLAELEAELDASKQARADDRAAADAREADYQAQLEDERLRRLNMVEEAIERRGLNNANTQEDIFQKLLDDAVIDSTIYTPMTDTRSFGNYMVMWNSTDFVVTSGAPEIELVFPQPVEE